MSAGVDRELLAVLVALEPLGDRAQAYLNLRDRTFDSDRMREEPWSSGERVLIDVAASLWNTGTVDLGYIAAALSGRYLQAVLDATAIRAGHDFASNMTRAVARIGGTSGRPSASPAPSAAYGLTDDRLPRRESPGQGR